jgi:hypothetical protein
MSAAHELLVRTRREQSLPEHIEDEGVLAQIAALLGPSMNDASRAVACNKVS